MKSFFILVFATLVFATPQSPEPEEIKSEEGMTTYYFIRHAEKDTSDPSNKDPELATEGKERAANWAEVFKETSFDLIYSTPYNRTRQTAEVIAKAKDLQVQIYNPRTLYDQEFQKATKGKKVLVVGHSNTNPQFVNMILQENKYQSIDEAESGSLFIVTLSPSGEKSSELLYIN